MPRTGSDSKDQLFTVSGSSRAGGSSSPGARAEPVRSSTEEVASASSSGPEEGPEEIRFHDEQARSSILRHSRASLERSKNFGLSGGFEGGRILASSIPSFASPA